MTFADYPYISPDKKYLICILSNAYEYTADLEPYEISGQKLTKKLSASFMRWMPAMENEELFWGSDCNFYAKIHNMKTFWKKSGMLNDHYQYIRIKIL